MELDYEQYKLVREALHERRIFLQTAPYLSAMLPIMLPIYKFGLIFDCAQGYYSSFDVGTGRFRITGRVARCTTFWPARRTWSLRI